MRHPEIFNKIIQRAERLGKGYLLLSAVVFSVASTIVIVSVMSIIFHGRITQDYLVTGVVASFLVSLMATYMLLRLFSELKERNERVAIAEEHYRTLFDSIQDCVCTISLEGRFLNVNETMRKLNEIETSDELVGKSCLESIVENRTEMQNAIKRVAAGETVSIQYKNITKRGKELWWDSKLTPLKDKDGNIKNILRISRDITDRKQAENELKEMVESLRQMRIASLNIMEDLRHEIMEHKKTEEALREKSLQLDELNRTLEQRVAEEVKKNAEKDSIMIHQSRLAAMGEMIGAIAHQWRQPLNALGLIIQDIQDAKKFGELTDEYLAKAVEKGMKQIQFMSKTIDDFRNFFRPDKERQAFDVKLAAGDVFSMLSAQLNSNNISYRLTCHEHNKTAEDFSGIIPCDAFNIAGYPNEMKQVFMNIVNNAKDAILQRREEGLMQEGEKGLIAFDFYRAGDNVIIRITDNGGGIPEEIIDKIFDPYFTTKEQGKGTGIGLYMSKMIIEQNMGGKLTVRNVDGGAEFRIELPITPPRKFTNKSRD